MLCLICLAYIQTDRLRGCVNKILEWKERSQQVAHVTQNTITSRTTAPFPKRKPQNGSGGCLRPVSIKALLEQQTKLHLHNMHNRRESWSEYCSRACDWNSLFPVLSAIDLSKSERISSQNVQHTIRLHFTDARLPAI